MCSGTFYVSWNMINGKETKTMLIKNIYRDVTLQQVSEADIGREIRVAGWIENIRDHGGVSFVDLRDMYGVHSDCYARYQH